MGYWTHLFHKLVAPVCSLINAGFYFLKPDESSEVFTIKEMFKQLPPKIPKALFKSPIIFLLSPGPCPSFPPWLALPPVHCPSPHSVLATSSLEPVNTALGNYFIFILSSPQSKCCRSSHQTLLPSLLFSWHSLSTTEAALAHGSWQLNRCDTAQPTHQKGGITFLFANIAHVQPKFSAALQRCSLCWVWAQVMPCSQDCSTCQECTLWSPA